MLPEDTKQRKEAATGSSKQTALPDHFNNAADVTIPYSAKAFETAAIEWLVSTNQVSFLWLP
jgi:hypothetical protein